MMQEGIQLRVSDFIYAIKKRFKLIIIMFILGIIAGVALSGASYLQGTMSKSYRITSTAVFLTQNTTGTFTKSKYAEYSDLQMATDMVETVKYVIKSEKMMNTVIDKTGIAGVEPSDISSHLEITQQGDTPVMSISLTWRSAEEGTDILTAIIDSSTSVMKDTLTTGKLSIIDPPSSRYIVGGNMGIPVWGMASALGLLLGVGFALLEIMFKPTLINTGDVEPDFGLELLGSIKKDNDYFGMDTILPIRNISTDSQVVQEYSSIAHILKNRLDKRKQGHIFYVTSTTKQEGRSFIAANIALQLAEMEHKVLLIDFDTRNPSIGNLMLGGTDYGRSLNALYRNDINEVEAVTKVNGYLDVLPAILEHTRIPMDSAIFSTIKDIAKDYEYTIIDTTPVGEVAEALNLNEIAETALFVIGFDMAIKQQIQTAIEKLDKSGVRILGCVVNKETGGSFKDAFFDLKKLPVSRPKKVRRDPEDREPAVKEKSEDDISRITDKPSPIKTSQVKKEKRSKKVGKERIKTPQQNKTVVKPKRSSIDLLNEISDEGNAPMSDEEALEALMKLEFKQKN